MRGRIDIFQNLKELIGNKLFISSTLISDFRDWDFYYFHICNKIHASLGYESERIGFSFFKEKPLDFEMQLYIEINYFHNYFFMGFFKILNHTLK